MNKKTYLIFGSAFLIFLIALFLYRSSLKKMNEYIWWVNHTQEVIIAFEQLSGDLKSAQMMPSEFGRYHKNAMMELYRQDIKNIPSDIQNVEYLVRDNKAQLRKVNTLKSIYNEHIKWMLEAKFTDSISLQTSVNHFKKVLATQRLIDSGIKSEKELLAERKVVFNRSLARTNVLTAIFISISVILILSISASILYQVKKRQDVELFLESILNTSQNGIITYQAIRNRKGISDFKVIFANDSIQRQTGIISANLIGKTLVQVSPATIENGTLERYIRVLETGKKDEFDTTYTVNDTQHWFHVILAKLNDGFTATYHDITELKNYQEELQKKVELLQSSNTELEQFAYVASHDLQEPLRKIKTFASLINERFNEPSAAFAKVYLDKVIQSAERMSALISDLLSLSNLSKEKQSFERIDLNTILSNVLIDFELIIDEKKALITNDRLPAIEAIPLQMNQLFYNLINNALKFSRQDFAPHLKISCIQLSGEEVNQHNLDRQLIYYKIMFHDNGIGFDSQYAEKIFIVFQRLNSRLIYAGSGIGLALCKKIVLNHNGVIYAEGIEGKGALFHIIIPEKQPRKNG